MEGGDILQRRNLIRTDGGVWYKERCNSKGKYRKIILSRIDTRFMSPYDIRAMLKMTINGAADHEECLILRKEQIQRFYVDKLSGEDVVFIEKQKKTLFNRVMQDTCI